MRTQLQKYVSFILMLMVWILLALPTPVVAAEDGSDVYYGEAYYDLQSDDLRYAYRIVEEGIASLSPRITFEGIVEINYKQLQDVLQAVCVDHPEYFWFLESGTFTHGNVNHGGRIISFDPTYILDGEEVAVGSQELADAMYAFHTKVQQIIHSIPVNLTTDYEIALYLHDYLAEHVTYTLEGEHPSAYAALIHGQAACYGYSKAYQCLLNAAGIRARTITGDGPDGNGKMVGHAWNQVWLDGKCYYTDVTWDDFDEVTLHSYFAISLEEMAKDHFAEDRFVLPECDHEAVNYYILSAGKGVAIWNDYTTPQNAAASFRLDEIGPDGAVFVCQVQFNGVNIFNWLGKQYADVFRYMGIDDEADIYYYEMQNVYHLLVIDQQYRTDASVISQIQLNADAVTLTGVGTCFQILPQVQSNLPWTTRLVHHSSDEAVARVDETGIITAVSEGMAVITVSSPDGSVKATCTVTVAAAPEHVHTLRPFAAEEPTCVQDGYHTHYLCTGCGIRFADDGATQPLLKTADFIIPATGHLEYTWDFKLNYHVYKCSCGYEKPNTAANHSDSDSDDRCDTCQGIMPEQGNFNLGANQADQGAAKEKKLAGWVIPTVVGIAVVVAVVVIAIIRKRRRDDDITPF